MKKYIIFIIAIFFVAISSFQNVEAASGEFVYSNVTIDGKKGIKISNLVNRSQTQVTIPEKINNLPVLVVWLEDMNIKTVDVSRAVHLRELSFHNNDLTTIDINHLTKLTNLKLSANRLGSLKIDALTNLTEVNVMYNFIKELNVSNLTNLKSLYVSSNELAVLDVANLKKLELLIADRNQLTALDVGKLVNLKTLQVYENYLTTLDVGNLTNLTSLKVQNNRLTELNVTNLVNLRSLDISNSLIKTIDTSNMPRLSSVSFYLTQLSLKQKNELFQKGIVSKESIKPIINFETVSDSEVKLTVSDSHSEIKKVEYAWVKVGEQVTDWKTMFDNSVAGNEILWSLRKSSGYGVWTTGKTVVMNVPESLRGNSYKLHVRATDMFDNTLQSVSPGNYQLPFENNITFQTNEMDQRVTIVDKEYRFYIDDLQFRINKAEVDQWIADNSNLKITANKTNNTLYEIVISSNGNPVVLRESLYVTFKNQPGILIALEQTDTGNRFIPQFKNNGVTEAMITRSINVLLSEGAPFELVDIPANHYSYTHVASLVRYKIVNGISSTEYGGDRRVTRAEFAVLVARSLGLDTSNITQTHFTDVNLNSWYGKEVQALYEAGIIQGTSATTFGTNDEITRQDTAVLMHRLIKRFNYESNDTNVTIYDIDEVSNYAKEAAQTLTNMGIINGYGQVGIFKPLEKLTRYQMAKILDLTLIELQLKNT